MYKSRGMEVSCATCGKEMECRSCKTKEYMKKYYIRYAKAKKLAGDNYVKRSYLCNICEKVGHNSRTCKSLPSVSDHDR